MKQVLIAALLLAGCSDNSAAPANSVEPAAKPVSPATEPSPAAAAGGTLTGSVSSLNADTSGLDVRITETRTIVDLPADTLFAFDRADLTPAATTNLVKVAELVRQAPAGVVELIGHTDAKGDEAYNLALSRQRAQAVADWMGEQAGTRQRQFLATGKGEAEPLAANQTSDGKDDPAGRTKNRRVTVSIPR